MKIAVNIQPMLHSCKSGIGYYQHELLRALLEDDRENEYIFNFFDVRGDKLPAAEALKRENTALESCRWFSASLYHLIWSIVPLPYGLFFKGSPDVSVFFNYYLPPFVKGKRVLAVYDTVIKDFPETVRFKTRVMLTLTLKRSVRRADRIITISEFSKRQIVRHFKVPPEKISVISCAADGEKYRPPENREAAYKRICGKYGIKRDYYLYLGNLEPRKNISRLVEAYGRAREKRAELPQLVIAGGKGWLYESIFAKVKELDLSEDVIFTGYVEDSDVPLMMGCAAAFCFPSLYEGFGMPPLEAMSCGVPVIVSDSASLPEVTGDVGISVNALDENEIADALIKVLDPDFAKEQSRLGPERAALFSWKKSAGELMKIFEELCNG